MTDDHTSVPRLSNFEVVKKISTGAYGVVFQQNEQFALKASTEIEIDDTNSSSAEFQVDDADNNALNATVELPLARSEMIEAMILQRAATLTCAQIVKLNKLFFDCLIDGKQFTMGLQMELAECSLIDFYRQRRHISLDGVAIRRSVMSDVAKAVHFLHSRLRVQHCDLKPANILVKSISTDIECRLADFGMSTTPHFATHGHGAMSYSFAYRPLELFDNLKTGPELLIATPQLCSVLQNMSCFDMPAVDTPLQENSASHLQQPAAVVATHNNGLDLSCEEELQDSPSTPTKSSQINKEQQEITNSFATLVQADENHYRRVTRALFASDIWALGSILLFLQTSGQHPVEQSFFWLRKSLFSQHITNNLQPDLRVQIYAWHQLLSNHQQNQELYVFEKFVEHFETAVASQSEESLLDIQSIDSLFQEFGIENVDEMDLLLSCLQFDPRLRPTSEQLCQHAFLNASVVADSSSSSTNSSNGKKRTRSSLRNVAKINKQTVLCNIQYSIDCMKQTAKTTRFSYYDSSCQLLWRLCVNFKFCYKTAILAIAYLQQTAHNISKLPYDTWTSSHRNVHVAVCVLMAAVLYETRHSFDSDRLVEQFGQQCGFSHRDLADTQRLFCEAVQFRFDMPTCAIFIDEALLATNSFSDMNVALLATDIFNLAARSYSFLSVSESLSTAMAFLKRYRCEKALQHLLHVSGCDESSVDKTQTLLDKIL